MLNLGLRLRTFKVSSLGNLSQRLTKSKLSLCASYFILWNISINVNYSYCPLGCSLCNIELAFLIDSSTKSNPNAWTQMLNFVSEVVRQYNINSNCVRVAVIRYGNNADAPIQLTSYNDVNRLVAALGQIQPLGGSSNLAAALNLLRSQVFASNVVRTNTARIAIIVTDQLQSNSQITSAAANLRSQGITIVAVGITGPGRVNTNYMYSITSSRRAIPVGDYSQLISGARNRLVQQYACLRYTPPLTGTGMFKCFFQIT